MRGMGNPKAGAIVNLIGFYAIGFAEALAGAFDSENVRLIQLIAAVTIFVLLAIGLVGADRFGYGLAFGAWPLACHRVGNHPLPDRTGNGGAAPAARVAGRTRLSLPNP